MNYVLLVGEEESIRLLIEAALEGDGCAIRHAENGPEALRLARETNPDLVVLDWTLAGLDGLELLRAFRRDPATSSIPLVLVTTAWQRHQREEALAADADAYLFRPFSVQELVRTIHGLLWQRQRGPGDPPPRPALSPSE